MLPSKKYSIHLFRAAGIDVYLHWLWFAGAIWRFFVPIGQYDSRIWIVAEILSLFLIVLLHEFGHALACRSVGGQADQIILWPFGGVAFVAPPQRPGAVLWSIAAGPLVNVVLTPILGLLLLAERHLDWSAISPDGAQFIEIVFVINLVLLCFNMLPVYPLDGGQILQALLWFIVGRARSLQAATLIGFAGAAGFTIWALSEHAPWLLLMTGFLFSYCITGWKVAGQLRKIEDLPRRTDFACPACKTSPLIGPLWHCFRCHMIFDTFLTGAVCPQCGERFEKTFCPECKAAHPMAEWIKADRRAGAR